MSIQAMNWAIKTAREMPKLTAAERMLLFALAHHHHSKTGECHPAVSTLAEIVGLSERRTQANLQSLRDKGLINILKRTVGGRQRTNEYVLRGDASSTPKPRLRGDVSNAPQQVSRGVTPASPNKESIYTGDGVVRFPSRKTGAA